MVSLTTALQPNASIVGDVLRWSYSQHFFAESKGEEVIEDLLRLCNKSAQRKMLSAQLKDEEKHVRYFTKITNVLGLEKTADQFAKGYVELIATQKTLSEKIYCFQILTESVSAAFCQWRLTLSADATFNAFDREVHADEEKHMKMGECMLSICDQDEQSVVLTGERQRFLLRSMNQICLASVDASALHDYEVSKEHLILKKSLAWQVSKTLLKESKRIEAPLAN